MKRKLNEIWWYKVYVLLSSFVIFPPQAVFLHKYTLGIWSLSSFSIETPPTNKTMSALSGHRQACSWLVVSLVVEDVHSENVADAFAHIDTELTSSHIPSSCIR